LEIQPHIRELEGGIDRSRVVLRCGVAMDAAGEDDAAAILDGGRDAPRLGSQRDRGDGGKGRKQAESWSSHGANRGFYVLSIGRGRNARRCSAAKA
jgi:hypothetical protein